MLYFVYSGTIISARILKKKTINKKRTGCSHRAKIKVMEKDTVSGNCMFEYRGKMSESTPMKTYFSSVLGDFKK